MSVKWTVSLSNGETLYEEKGEYLRLAGEPSPWMRLEAYLAANALTLTSLGLYTDDGRSFNLPSKGRNPKFHAFDGQEPPTGYRFSRKAGINMLSEVEDNFAVIEALYPDHTLQLWVDENHPENCWVNRSSEEAV